jgi:hypothetical protein
MRNNDGCGCILGLVLVVMLLAFSWDVITGFLGLDEAREPEPRQQPVISDTVTIIVAGSEGGQYRVKWEDEAKTVRGKRLDTLGSSPTSYRMDIDNTPTRSNSLEIIGSKTQPWEGDLNIVLKLGERLATCDSTTRVRPHASVMRLRYSFGQQPSSWDSFYCRTQLW